jgi:hypothetical protein
MNCPRCGTALKPGSCWPDQNLDLPNEHEPKCRDILAAQLTAERARVAALRRVAERLFTCLAWYADPDGGTDDGEWAKKIIDDADDALTAIDATPEDGK